jgi:hypothetical protein
LGVLGAEIENGDVVRLLHNLVKKLARWLVVGRLLGDRDIMSMTLT